jgi:hypothetical protein
LEILDVALLRLRFPISCSLDLSHNLPFLNEHFGICNHRTRNGLRVQDPEFLSGFPFWMNAGLLFKIEQQQTTSQHHGQAQQLAHGQ